MIVYIARSYVTEHNTNVYNLTPKFVTLSVRGFVVAGWPSPAEEELGDTLTFEEWLVPHKEASWLVHVSTEAMGNDGILPGDVAILERGRDPQQGDIVIAHVDEQTVIRRYEIQNGRPALVSTNPVFPTLFFDERAELLGVVVTIIRKYK